MNSFFFFFSLIVHRRIEGGDERSERRGEGLDRVAKRRRRLVEVSRIDDFDIDVDIVDDVSSSIAAAAAASSRTCRSATDDAHRSREHRE